MYKIAIVDDHQMFREGLQFLLSEMENIKIVAEAEDGLQFIAKLEENDIDLVFMDISMPNMDGIETTKVALESHPKLKVIALTMFGEENYYYKMIHAGANGFLLKKSGSYELAEAIETVMTGGDYFSVDLLKNIVLSLGKEQDKQEEISEQRIHITDDECKILLQICAGMNQLEIARELNIQEQQVKKHVTSLFEKTDTQNFSSLIMHAIKNKLVQL